MSNPTPTPPTPPSPPSNITPRPTGDELEYRNMISYFKWIAQITGAAGAIFLGGILYFTYGSAKEMKEDFKNISSDMNSKLDESFLRFNRGIDAMEKGTFDYQKGLQEQTDKDIAEFKDKAFDEIKKARFEAASQAKLAVKNAFEMKKLDAYIEELALAKVKSLVDSVYEENIMRDVDRLIDDAFLSNIENATFAAQMLSSSKERLSQKQVDTLISRLKGQPVNLGSRALLLSALAYSKNERAITYVKHMLLTSELSQFSDIPLEPILLLDNDIDFITKYLEKRPGTLQRILSKSVNNPNYLYSIINSEYIVDALAKLPIQRGDITTKFLEYLAIGNKVDLEKVKQSLLYKKVLDIQK